MRVLIVEDSEDTADVLSILLDVNGHEPLVARNGQEALEYASSNAGHIDAVLLDLGLPDLTGLEVCRRLRATFGERRALIVAVSGWARQRDQLDALAAGCDHYFMKPVPFERINRLLRATIPSTA